MPLNKAQKGEISKTLVENIGSSESVVFVKFGGLAVSESNILRRDLRDKGVGYMVSKKTLLKRALADNNVNGEMPALDGQISIAFGKDSVTPAKLVADFQKKFKEKLFIVGGILTGKYLSAPEMIALSKIPSREVLLSQLLNVMNASIKGFVVSLDQIAKKKA